MTLPLLLFCLAADPAPVEYTLPTNPALAADRHRRRVTWLTKQWLGDFDANADPAAPGHAESRKAVELAVEAEARVELRAVPAADARDRALRAAAKTGNLHPVLWVLLARFQRARVDAAILATDDMAAGRYSPYVRALAHREAARESKQRGHPDTAAGHARRCATAVAELAADPDPMAVTYTGRMVALMVAEPAFGRQVADRLAVITPALAGPAVPARVRDLAAGAAAVTAAWEVRGPGSADTVSDDQFAEFRRRLEAAAPRLAAAWEADPSDPLPANDMLNVCMGLGKPRAEMERWFKRAMTAEPDNYPACHAKLTYLGPKWHGSPEELLAFGRQCVAAARPENRLADLLYEAHLRINTAGKGTYWAEPATWAELTAAHAPALALHPTDRQIRSRMARLAYSAGRPEEADAHLKAIKDQVYPPEFSSTERAARFRADVDVQLKRKRAADDDQ